MDDFFLLFFNLILHPRLVHFPIALLLIGVLAIFLNEIFKKDWLNEMAIKMIGLGWILTIPAILTGLVEQRFILNDTLVNQIVKKHMLYAFIMWILFGWALYCYYKWKEIKNPILNKLLLLLILFVAAIFLVLTTHLGGTLVFKYGVGVL